MTTPVTEPARGVRPAKDARIARILMMLPATVLFVVFFIMPIALLTVNSFYDYGRVTGIVHVFTMKNYVRLLSDVYYLEIIGRTIYLATLTSLVTLVIGYPVALYLTVASPTKRAIIIFLVLSPLAISVVIRTLGWVVIFGRGGLLPNMAAYLGLPGGELLHSQTAVLIGMVNIMLPFMVLSIATSLQGLDPALPLAAESLGANAMQVLRKVVIPLSMPGILAGTLIVFSLTASAFVTPSVLGGAQFRVLTVTMYQQAVVLLNWPFAAAMAVTLIVVVFIVQALQTEIVERSKYRAVFG